ncbi:hypothetical protein ACOQNP_14090 [Ectopseudomonas khazarica]|uniref:hypothetical protein n=1 Tax=Ectopseudomonas khazarica TaxID=2502979 RepID=UPI003B92600B
MATVRSRAYAHRKAGAVTAYRSGLEEKIAQQLEAAGIPVAFEQYRLKYVVPAREASYKGLKERVKNRKELPRIPLSGPQRMWDTSGQPGMTSRATAMGTSSGSSTFRSRYV